MGDHLRVPVLDDHGDLLFGGVEHGLDSQADLCHGRCGAGDSVPLQILTLASHHLSGLSDDADVLGHTSRAVPFRLVVREEDAPSLRILP